MLIHQISSIYDLDVLNNFFRIVESDNSSILYHTRCFDLFIFDCILTDFVFNLSCDIDESVYLFGIINISFIYNMLAFTDSLLEFLSFSKFFLENSLDFFDNSELLILNINIANFYSDLYFYFIEENTSSIQLINISLLIKNFSLFIDFIFFFDFFLYMFEILVIFLIFFYFRGTLSAVLAFASSFYINILNFFIKNGLSIVEFSFLFTFFIFFIIFDMFVSFSEDDFFDIFFYIIIIFITLTFFFINIALDVQYFFMMNSVNNGYLNFRVLFFDIINNFLCLLRVFSCWVRYIFYDLQVELLDLSFWYIDYSNDYLLFDNINNMYKSNNSLLIFFKIFFFDFINFFFDLVFILVQVWVSFVKIFLASYLLWLITDLFILRVFGYSESRSIRKN